MKLRISSSPFRITPRRESTPTEEVVVEETEVGEKNEEPRKTPTGVSDKAKKPKRSRGVEETQGESPYLTRLVTLIPSEVVALYLTFKEVAIAFLPVWAVVCLALVVIVRCAGARDRYGHIQIFGVVIASISFVLWIYATGGEFPQMPRPSVQGVVPVSIGVWTFIVPYFYRGEERASGA